MNQNNHQQDMKEIMQKWAGKNFIIVNKDFAQKHGYRNAVVFGNMCSMAKQFNNDFFYLIENIAEQSFMCKQYVRESIKYLQENEFIKTERRGIPSKVFYSVNLNKIKEMNKETVKEIEKNKKKMLGLAITYDDTTSINKECDGIYNNTNTNNTDDFQSSSFSKEKESDIKSSIEVRGEPRSYGLDRGLFFNEEKNHPIKEKEYFNQQEKQLLKMIEEIIQDTDTNFKHRLPNDKNKKPTVLIKKVIKYMNLLMQGKFIDSIILSSERKQQFDDILLHTPLLMNQLHDVIWKALDRWKQHFIVGYSPENKDILQNISLDTWFYNERTQYSWFLECYNNEPQLIQTITAEKLKSQIPEDFLKWFDKLYQYKFHVMSDEDIYRYYMGVLQIYARHRQLRYLYDGVVQYSGWRNYLAPESGFAQNFYLFLRDYPHWENVKMLKTSGALWNDFRCHALREWKVDINPTEEFINQAIRDSEYQEELIAKRKRQEEIDERNRTKEMLEKYGEP